MANMKSEFKVWMGQQKKLGSEDVYSENSVSKCCTTLNTMLDKIGLVFGSLKNNCIFDCDNYSDFIQYEYKIRELPDYAYWDGPGQGQRWIHNGLQLYGKFLLEVEGSSEETRVDYLENVIESEGRKICFYTTRYERSKRNRDAAIRIHGTKCKCCGFDFEKVYGERGKDFIEVHHIVPLADRNEQIKPNPETDFVCLCSNCHRMIHRKKYEILSVEELIAIIEENQKV